MNMKTSFYLFASVALILMWRCDGAEIRHKRSEGDAADSTKACVPGTTWFDGCNNCFCTDTGIAGCTMRACIETPQPLTKEEDKVVAKRSAEGEEEEKCVPGTTWKDDCNTCFCSANGLAACTLMGCITLPPVQQEQTR